MSSSELGARAWDVTKVSSDFFLSAALWYKLDVMDSAGLDGAYGDGEGGMALGVGRRNDATE